MNPRLNLESGENVICGTHSVPFCCNMAFTGGMVGPFWRKIMGDKAWFDKTNKWHSCMYIPCANCFANIVDRKRKITPVKSCDCNVAWFDSDKMTMGTKMNIEGKSYTFAEYMSWN